MISQRYEIDCSSFAQKRRFFLRSVLRLGSIYFLFFYNFPYICYDSDILMSTTLTIYFLSLLFVLTLTNLVFLWILLFRFRKIKQQSEVFFSGRNGKDLESTILSQFKHLKKLDEETRELYDICEKIHNLASTGLYKVGYVRFNPFKDVGGDQSFAISLLDGKKNGIVLSSLFTREGTRVYSKPVIAGHPTKRYPFTEEEKKAIELSSSKKFQEEDDIETK